MHQTLESQLAKWANSRRGTPFQWGVCDCNTLALEALDLIAGTNLACEVVGQYNDEESAKIFYEFYQLDWLRWDGFTGVGRNFVQTGDFIIADEGSWCVPYVVVGPNALSCFQSYGVRACRVGAILKAHPAARCFRSAHREVV